MASKNKKSKKELELEQVQEQTQELEQTQKPEEKIIEPKKESKKVETEPKHKIGSIVFISKDADADLNGFKLFPQYKKYTYTVEAYDQISDVYTLRRLNLSLRLKSEFILAPDERAHDSINRRQY